LKDIHFFNYEGNDKVFRKITVIDGVPFYCSSGINSGSPETWFPFLGLNINGWFRKPGSMDELSSQIDTIPESYDDYFDANGTDILKSRFASLKCLLISSVLGGGFWEQTVYGQKLLTILQKDYPDFYKENEYKLQDSSISFSVENQPALSVEIRKTYRRVNELLEKATHYSLDPGFDATLLKDNFIQFGIENGSLESIQNTVVNLFKPNYPQFPKTISPTYNDTLIWPDDYEKSLFLTKDEKEEADRYIREVYPKAIDEIKDDPEYSDSTLSFITNINQLYIKVLNNGEVIVHHGEKIQSGSNTSIFKAFNLSRGEWNIIKLGVYRRMHPYVKQLSDEPHIAKIYGLTGVDNRLSHVGKLYHSELTDLLIADKSLSLSTAQKEKYMLSLLQGLNAIHKVPFKFDNTEGYLFHQDIKFANIFYDADADDVVIGDLDSAGSWDELISTNYFVAPEYALEVLKIPIQIHTPNHIITFNKTKGQGIDVWNLGLVFAGLLQGRLINHPNYGGDVYLPKLNFLLDRIQTTEHRSQFMMDMASLEQEEIDEELNQIKQNLPKDDQGQKLAQLWDIVHNMLQTAPRKRLTCTELLKKMQTPLSTPAEQASLIGLRKNSLFAVQKGPDIDTNKLNEQSKSIHSL
jgi:serine/threonine protein kinase